MAEPTATPGTTSGPHPAPRRGLGRWLAELSIASRLLLWFTGLALLPMLVVTVAVYAISDDALRREVTGSLETIAESKRDRIEQYIRERELDVGTLAGLPQLVDATEGYAAAFERAGVQSEAYLTIDRALRPFLAAHLENLGYGELILVSTGGDVVFSLQGQGYLGTNYYRGIYANTELARVFDRAKTLIETEMSDFEFYPALGEPAVFIAAPVFRRRIVVGVAIVRIDNSQIYAAVNEHTGLGRSGQTIVGARIGDELVLVVPPRHDPEGAFRRVAAAAGSPLADAVRGTEGAGLTVDYRGREVVAAWLHVPSLRWGMIVQIDTDEALAPLAAQRYAIFVLAGVTLLGALGIALVVARSISEPIVYLTRAVRRISGGDLGQQVPVTARDEIGELGRAFNKMTAELARAEAKVGEQTRSLQETNASLDRARYAAEAASRAKSSFLANVSHELRTPLNAIIGYAELLKEEAEGDDAALIADLQKICDAGQHLLVLVDGVLDLSKIEAGKMELYEETFSLEKVLREVLSTVAPVVARRGNALVADLPEGLGELRADLLKLRQVLFNLLANAAKFTEDGTITVAALRDEAAGRVRFTVADTGIGMTPAQLSRLFQPFTQAESDTARTYGGTGLGLALCRRFCELMGGQIAVESEFGRGTTFTVTLPLDRMSAGTSGEGRPPGA